MSNQRIDITKYFAKAFKLEFTYSMIQIDIEL